MRYAQPSGRPLLDVLSCIHHKTRLAEAGRLLSPNAKCYLKSPHQMTRLFSDLPRAVRSSQELGERIQFTLESLGYRFPEYPVPAGESVNS